MTRGTARSLMVAALVGSLIASVLVGLRSDTPGWSPVTWGIFFLVAAVFAAGPIALVLEWRVTRGWTRPNPYAEERRQIEEPLAHR